MPLGDAPDPRTEPLASLRFGASAMKAFVDGPSERRTFMKGEAFLIAAERFVSPIIAVDEGNIRYLLDTSDRGPITVGLATTGRWDEPLMRRTLDLLTKLTGREAPLRDRVFVDVGGNIGTATLCAMKRFDAARGLALEPEPKNFKMLRLNLLANDLEEQVIAVQAAVSDEPGTLQLEISDANVGDHRIRTGDEADGGALAEAGRRVVEVPAVTLDTALRDHAIAAADIGLVWIDVQGHEPKVLAGAAETIASGAPILIEYWPYGLRRQQTLGDIHALIREGFTEVWDIGEERDTAPPVLVDPGALDALAARFPDINDATNLLLLKKS